MVFYRSRQETAQLAAVAQLDRVFGYEPKGRGFESLQPYQNPHIRTLFLQECICGKGDDTREALSLSGIFVFLRGNLTFSALKLKLVLIKP